MAATITQTMTENGRNSPYIEHGQSGPEYVIPLLPEPSAIPRAQNGVFSYAASPPRPSIASRLHLLPPQPTAAVPQVTRDTWINIHYAAQWVGWASGLAPVVGQALGLAVGFEPMLIGYSLALISTVVSWVALYKQAEISGQSYATLAHQTPLLIASTIGAFLGVASAGGQMFGLYTPLSWRA